MLSRIPRTLRTARTPPVQRGLAALAVQPIPCSSNYVAPRDHQPARKPTAACFQLTRDKEDFYGRLIASALLAGNSNAQDGPSGSESGSNEPHLQPRQPGSEGPEDDGSTRVTDREWEIRTGRAIDVLQQTLPDFFEIGLVSTVEKSQRDASDASSASQKSSWPIPIPAGTWSTLKDKLTSTSNAKSKDDDAPESIYSPSIRLTYTPPQPLPTPFPNTLRLEGLHLYTASSIFVRHTLNALYTDLAVEILRMKVQSANRSQRSNKHSRERSIAFGLAVSGMGRVSGVRAEWEVNCTYTFSPLTGLILHHSVDSIEPAPHQALFEALGKFGLLEGGPVPGVGRPGGVGS